jgi:hypothetical protein
MFENLWNRIAQWFTDRQERNSLIRSFNASARAAYVAGIAPTLLRASVSKGNRAYRHQFSNWLYSGFRIQAFTGRVLTKNELVNIGEAILNDDMLVRRMVVLGWDTLETHGDVGSYGCRWQLKDFLQLQA